ncbi:ABC transporter permease [Terrimonas pollutisoli]|uniref:ABC transporter permease n=1 Tax=Terrimonas pollutisoli TaxID=3034147 RepID=UPI0023EB545D|nr:FtsX-like permease family protein [Terrimonas sp. H1YJ31]
MIKNYFKIAWRNMVRSKGYSAINIGGLAVGMAVAMLIAFWIYDELNFNKYHKNYDRIAQVMQHQTFNGTKVTGTAIPFPLTAAIQSKYGNDFKYLVMSSWQGDKSLSAGDKKLRVEGNFMGADVARMLTLNMIKGSYDALKDPHSIILSASTAKALFGNEEAMNKLVKISNTLDVKVTGVYADLPHDTRFSELHFIAPWDLFVSSEKWVQDTRDQNQWGNNSFQLFAQVADNVDINKLNAKIIHVKQDQLPAEEKKFKAEIFLNSMAHWHLRSNWEEGIRTGGPIQYVWMFGIVGIFVLLLACINFMNLATARSEKRAREVGIRKAVGSVRWQIIKQFFGESLLVVLLAFLVACLVVCLSLPWFNQVTSKEMTFPFDETFFWIMSLAFVFLTALLAGSYPAFYLSSFNPVKVLKGTFRVGRFASVPRKVLVVLQFTVSVALIIGTILVYRQMQHTKNRPLGYDNKGVIMIPMSSPDFFGKYDQLRNELKGKGIVIEMAESSSPLTQIWSNWGGFTWPGKDPNTDADFSAIWVTHEYGKTVGWQFTKGRDFSRDFSTDSAGLVINEAAVKFMNLKDPVGTVVENERNKEKYTIVGVVKDMLMESPYDPIRQAFYFLNYNRSNWIFLKLDPAKPVKTSLAAIEAVFKKQIPAAPFDYKFADEAYGEKFKSEERLSKLTAFFAILAIFISCLGLFGLASFVAEQRTKEIGIRKVIGASVFNLWKLLSKEFFLLVIISCCIAVPVAYYYMNEWLHNYRYRTDITWHVFALAIGGALVITLLTVSFQAIKAAITNPVKSLRTE